MCLACVVDIFQQLNIDSLKASMTKLENWKREVKIKIFAMFEKLTSVLVAGGDNQVPPEFTKNENFQLLTALDNEFSRYFPELNDEELDSVRNPFKLRVRRFPYDCQDELMELKSDSGVKGTFDEK